MCVWPQALRAYPVAIVLMMISPPPRAVVNQSMRLFVIGHYSKGKSTLLEALKGNVRRGGIMNSFDIRTRRIGSNSDSLTPEGESVL